MTVQSGSRCYTAHAKTGIERHTRRKRKKTRKRTRKREKARREFHVHPCRASRFRRLRRRWQRHSRGLCTRARNVSISVSTPSFLCLSLPSRRFPPIYPRPRPSSSCGRRGAVSLLPLRPPLPGYVLPAACVITNAPP